MYISLFIPHFVLELTLLPMYHYFIPQGVLAPLGLCYYGVLLLPPLPEYTNVFLT